jgi:hypothetical protein
MPDTQADFPFNMPFGKGQLMLGIFQIAAE